MAVQPVQPNIIFNAFSQIKDSRINRQKRHDLLDIIIIAILAVISGADDWVTIQKYGVSKILWLKTFLKLTHGIPSHDTFGRVFSLINPASFSAIFIEFIANSSELIESKTIAIDGKTIRGSRQKSTDLKALHMVSAWCTENQIILGQMKTEEKSNEIPTIPLLLDMIDITGTTITIDAMGCQKEIAAKIIDKNANYILALKGNHGTLHEDITLSLDGADPEILTKKTGSCYQTTEGDHGRIETRTHWVLPNLEGLTIEGWPGLYAIGIIDRTREIDGKTSLERNYFLLNKALDPKEFAERIRSHWSIENQLHWSLDVSFSEDHCKIRDRYAAENFSTLRKLALILLKRTFIKGGLGVKNKRMLAGWDDNFLSKVLAEAMNLTEVKAS